MPPRQRWMFGFGCWLAVVTAALHLAQHVAGPPAPMNETERQILDLITTYRYSMPGGTERSLMDFMNGYSLLYGLQLAAIGVLGLVIQKRGREDRALMLTTARILGVAGVAMLAVSLLQFFIIPALFIAAMTTCFLVASVESPET